MRVNPSVPLHIADGARRRRNGWLETDNALGEHQGESDMSEAIVYVDTADVREGSLEELKAGIEEMVDFIESNEPRLIAYNVYFNDEGTRMTVVHVHPDSASLEYHLEVAGPLFRRFVELVTLSSIQVYGKPGERVLEQLQEKSHLLGGGAVVVAPLHAGFARFAIH
jgi:hypothetical protein